MSTVDLYDVLNLESSATKSEVKAAYRKLVRKHHPDRGGDPDLYELITHAYNVLIHSESRKQYDHAFELSQESGKGFLNLKAQAEEYLKQQEDEVPDEAAIEAMRKEFEHTMTDLDQKHGYSRTDAEEKEIDQQEFEKREEDLKLIREQQEIEASHEPLFADGEKFDPAKFNAAWDRMADGPTSLIAHTGQPDAWGLGSTDQQVGYAEFGGDLYDETNQPVYGREFSSIDLTENSSKLTASDLKKMTGAEYFADHADGAADDSYKKSLEERLKEREAETQQLKVMALDEFDPDETMGGYGISHQLGFSGDEITWDNDHSDLRRSYRKLLESREPESPQSPSSPLPETPPRSRSRAGAAPES